MNNITNIKDLVIQIMTNGKEIEAMVKKGDPESYFLIGMSHLLGINTSIDFEKAAQYFGDESLADDPDANRLLGYIAECEGKFGEAFQYYAKTGKSTRSYIQKVYEERGNLQSYLKKLNLPDTFFNKDITALLCDYIKDDSSILSRISIAYICEDEEKFLEETQALVSNGDLFSAIRWLKIGNVDKNNPLYVTIEKKLIKSLTGPNLSGELDVVNIDGTSLIPEIETEPSYAGIKYIRVDTAKVYKQKWCEMVVPIIYSYKNVIEQEEERRKREEEERRKREEEERRKKHAEEEQQLALLEERKKNARKEWRLLGIIYGFWLFLLLMGAQPKASQPDFMEKIIILVVVPPVLAGFSFVLIHFLNNKS